MATCQTGTGTVDFGTVFTGVFRAEDGFTIDMGTVAEVNCTSDTDTENNWEPGDLVDYGQVKGTLLIAAGVDVSAAVGTTESTTFTSPDGDTYAGDAFLVSAPATTGTDVSFTAALTFRWKSKPVFTALP